MIKLLQEIQLLQEVSQVYPSTYTCKEVLPTLKIVLNSIFFGQSKATLHL